MLTGLVQNYVGLLTCRILLAIFEAGFGAGVPYYLSLCYKRRELGFRVSILLGSSPIANCFAGAMAFGISHVKSSLEPWRLIFLIGKPTWYQMFRDTGLQLTQVFQRVRPLS